MLSPSGGRERRRPAADRLEQPQAGERARSGLLGEQRGTAPPIEWPTPRSCPGARAECVDHRRDVDRASPTTAVGCRGARPTPRGRGSRPPTARSRHRGRADSGSHTAPWRPGGVAEERRSSGAAVLVQRRASTPSGVGRKRIAASSSERPRRVANSVDPMPDPADRRRRIRVDSTDEAAVRAANQAFYDAFEARDLDAMSDVWEHSDRVSCTHPGWRTLHGWGAVSGSWFALFGGPSPLQFILTDERGVRGRRRRVGDRRREPHLRRRAAAPLPRVNLFVRREARLAARGATTGRRWLRRPDTAVRLSCRHRARNRSLPPTAALCARCAPARRSSTPPSACSRTGDLRPTAPRVAERAPVSVR